MKDVSEFRKKPVVIKAVKFTGDNGGELREFVGSALSWNPLRNEAHIATEEGIMRANAGDWIIKGVAGEFYPCKPDIFAETYEPAYLSAPVQPGPRPQCPKCGGNVVLRSTPIQFNGRPFCGMQCPKCMPEGTWWINEPEDLAAFFPVAAPSAAPSEEKNMPEIHEHFAPKRDDGHLICNVCGALFVNGEWLPPQSPTQPLYSKASEMDADDYDAEFRKQERVAQLIAHRSCTGLEHDPTNGKLHGHCVICGVPWPCSYAVLAAPSTEQIESLRRRVPAQPESVHELLKNALASTSEPPCEKCGKHRLNIGPGCTVASGMVRDIGEYYCHCPIKIDILATTQGTPERQLRCQARQPHGEKVQCELPLGHKSPPGNPGFHLGGEYCWNDQPAASQKGEEGK